MKKIRVRREIKRLGLYAQSGSPITDITRVVEIAEAEDWTDLKYVYKKRSYHRGFFNGCELQITGMRLEMDDEFKRRQDHECSLLKEKKEKLLKAQKDVDDLEKSLGSMTNCQ